MTSIADRLEIIAKENCSSVCAIYFGDPPCYQVGPWPNEECSDFVCAVIAKAVAFARAAKAEGEQK